MLEDLIDTILAHLSPEQRRERRRLAEVESSLSFWARVAAITPGDKISLDGWCARRRMRPSLEAMEQWREEQRAVRLQGRRRPVGRR